MNIVSRMGKDPSYSRLHGEVLDVSSHDSSESSDDGSATFDKNQQAVKTCFSGFLNYAVGTRESLSSRLDVLMTEGQVFP